MRLQQGNDVRKDLIGLFLHASSVSPAAKRRLGQVALCAGACETLGHFQARQAMVQVMRISTIAKN